MKKRWIAILLVICAVLLTAAVTRQRPLRDLRAADITAASVTWTPPGTTVQVQDLQALASALQKITVYCPDDSYTQYTGQTVAFTLFMADGAQLTVTESAAKGIYGINGTGWRVQEASCRELTRLANALRP